MNSRASRSASPNVLKTKKQITSKIDSGISKKSSTVTLMKSRQPSVASRDSSRQSLDRKSPTIRSRPTTSFSSARFSQSTKQGVGASDKLQQGVHKLGQLPAYLRGSRPATAVSKLRTSESDIRRPLDKNNDNIEAARKVLEFSSIRHETFRTHLSQQYGSYANSKAALDGLEKKSFRTREKEIEPNASAGLETSDLQREVARICTETDQIDSGVQVGCTPCEGEGSGDASLQQAFLLGNELELSEMHEKFRQLEANSKQGVERIAELETAVAESLSLVKQREREIEQNKETIRRLSEQIKELTAKLLYADSVLEEKEQKLYELLENETEKETILERQSKEIEVFKQRSEQYEQQIALLRQEVTGPAEPTALAEMELEAHRSEVNTLQEEIKKLRFENETLVSVKKQDDILLQIRSSLLENLEKSKESFKARLEEMSVYSGDVEGGSGSQSRTRAFDILFGSLADKQRRCCREEQIIGEIEQNNQKCKTMRNNLLDMLKRLKDENRQMRDIIRSNLGPNVLTENYEEPTKDGSRMSEQEAAQPNAEVPAKKESKMKEEILNIFKYDTEPNSPDVPETKA